MEDDESTGSDNDQNNKEMNEVVTVESMKNEVRETELLNC